MAAEAERHRASQPPVLKVVWRKPHPGFHHPAGKQDILKLLNAVGSVAIYGLRSVELIRAPAASSGVPPFGRYVVPGRIVLYEQPLSPWRLPGILVPATARRLEDAGAILTALPAASATVVDWPDGTLRLFMLEEVLLHEVGHHVLQHHKGKRQARIARTRDHEAFAARFAEKQRAALRERRSG